MKKNLKLFVLAVLGSWMAGSVMAEDHYVVGNATVGWVYEAYDRSPAAMVNVSENVWVWSGKISVADNVRFRITDGGWGGHWATSDGDLLGSEEKSLKASQDGGDFSFVVSEEGVYRVTVNTSTLKIKAEKLTEPGKDGDYYKIDNVDDYYWYAGMVTSTGDALKARLTADLDFSTTGFFSLACDKFKYKGEFDGGGHTMKNIAIIGSNNNVGFIRFATGGANIHDLVIEGSFTGNAKVGGVIGFARDGGEVKLTNVINKATVKSTGASDANAAGFVSCALDDTKITALNCANMGDVSGQDGECAAFAGWPQTGTSFTNCWNSGTISNMQGNFNLYRNKDNVAAVNCYDATGNESYAQGTKMAASTLATGEFCYALNEKVSGGTNWYQTIGTDDHPYPFASHAVVYAIGDEYCDGTPKGTLTYTNTEGAANRDDHHWGEWGFCDNSHDGKVCDHIQPGFVTLTDGYYQIGNAKELNWFAVWTDREDATINAKLTADIDMSGVANFPGIGSDARKFTGTFDGQRHIISNMKMEWEREGVGLVNRAANGAKVMNVTMASSCSFKGSKAVAGLIGGLYGGGDVYIENCGNEAAVVTTGQNAGGVCGVCFNGTILHLTNVYNVGTITGAADRESGSLSGWMANAVIKNCYSIAGYPSASDTHGFQEGNQFARGNDISLTNCYDFGTGSWGKNDGDWGACFKPGAGKIAEVNEAEMGRVFAGLYDGEGGNVWRMEYEGWEHPVLYDPAKLVLSENIPNRFTAAENVALTLKRTTVADNWNTFCAPFALDAAQIADVFGSGAKVAALTGVEGETMQFSTVSAIEPGKAYIVKPTTAITEKELTVDLVAGAPVADKQGGYAFTGIYEPTLIPQGDLFVAQENKLQPSDGEGKLKGFRAYFKQMGEGGVSAARFVIDGGETTGIIAVDGTVVENGSAYNLGGRKIANSKAAKGLYIVNGKKMVVK